MVGSRHHPHPFGLGLGLHTRRLELPVPEGLLLHGPDLLAARLLALLHVRPQPERGRGRGGPVRELHRQADRVLGARGSELLSSSWSVGVSGGRSASGAGLKDVNKRSWRRCWKRREAFKDPIWLLFAKMLRLLIPELLILKKGVKLSGSHTEQS